MKQVHLIPALEDNYIFCLQNGAEAVIVDPGDARPVLRFLQEQALTLSGILITHHHHDHIDGVPDLLSEFPAPVWIPAADQGRFEFGGTPLQEGDVLSLAGFQFQIWELPGHTLDHIAYIENSQKWIFSGDVLFGFGCGCLFEGTYEQAFTSLQRFRQLPPETKIYCTHEYTMANLKFLASLATTPLEEQKTKDLTKQMQTLLEQNGSTVPLHLKEQLEANPFLKTTSVPNFQTLRIKRNNF
ncbi:MAG: hydroxyacylglutathione hydrolase [Bdellovibrionaceae bacterium]|nr:hydroxyacylglutathione hydrolase [Pseudobdellovibrionaceae bacterium]